jgi:[acyl-carrier-protein] S-malonyltransferase
MLALQEASRAAAEAAIALGGRHGVVALAAVNAPAQWVLSGEWPALDAIAAQFPSRRLPVAGAWHCPLMAAAVPEFLGELRALTPGPLTAALIVNRSGRALGKTDDLCEALAGQLVRPVQWAASLETLDSLVVTDIVTVGPGRILRGLIRKNIGTRVRVHTTEDDADVERTVQRLRGALNDSKVSL